DLIIIETNRERVEDLRGAGFHVIAGDAGSTETLEEAMINKASALIVAIPEAFEVGRIVESARQAKPEIKIIIQDRYNFGAVDIEEMHVDLKVTGSEEIAKRMINYLDAIK
ncbi:MAG TPA: NAD-binding protein, partial [Alphaproteobacteria bacterium]|nr:NAD-binding protein [Alphaproteobacteria bacterium]